MRTYAPLLGIALLALVLLVWAPASLTPFRLGNLGKYCCWAIAAVGIAFAVQEIKAVPALPHDVALDYVLTEKKMFDFRS